MSHPFISRLRTKRILKAALTRGARWNFMECEAHTGTAILTTAPAGWWCHGMEGQRHPVVRIKQDGETFFICNLDGTGERKVWKKGGGPNSYHRSAPCDAETFIPNPEQPKP